MKYDPLLIDGRILCYRHGTHTLHRILPIKDVGSFATDGEFVIAVQKNGSAAAYRADSGEFLARLASKVLSCAVVDGLATIIAPGRTIRRIRLNRRGVSVRARLMQLLGSD